MWAWAALMLNVRSEHRAITQQHQGARGLTCHWIRTEEVVCGVTEMKLGGSPGTEIQGRRSKD